MSQFPIRKPIPQSIKDYFRLASKEEDKICPYCNSPLNGIYHISHVIPVIAYSDNQKYSLLVAMHPECNVKLGTNKLDISKHNKNELVICEF